MASWVNACRKLLEVITSLFGRGLKLPNVFKLLIRAVVICGLISLYIGITPELRVGGSGDCEQYSRLGYMEIRQWRV